MSVSIEVNFTPYAGMMVTLTMLCGVQINFAPECPMSLIENGDTLVYDSDTCNGTTYFKWTDTELAVSVAKYGGGDGGDLLITIPAHIVTTTKEEFTAQWNQNLELWERDDSC
jgi:hypothetical protein